MTKRPAFLVEGILEQKFVQNICPKSPVQRINCNGNNVCITSIAKRVGTLGRLLQRKHNLLIIVFDREKRDTSREQLIEEFLKALEEEDLKCEIVVGMPDRDIESWILADYKIFCLSASLTFDKEFQSSEGSKGKTTIKKLLGPAKPYVETVHGVKWLRSCRPTTMRQNSPSFASFAEALQSLGCWWLDQKEL